MANELQRAWRDAREKDLATWKLDELVKRRDQLGIEVDPRQDYSLAALIADAEMKLMELDPPIPGAVLEETEDDAPLKYDADTEEWDDLLPPFEAQTEKEFGERWEKAAKPVSEMVLDHYPTPAPTRGSVPGVEPQWHNKILLNVDPREMRTVSADSIVNVELPAWLSHFLSKNANYGDRHRTSRGGLKGETVNLDRKVDVVWKAFWEGQDMNHEQPRELVWDLIGSCFLMLDLLSIQEGRAIVADKGPMPDPTAY